MVGDGWQDHGFHSIELSLTLNNTKNLDCTSPVSLLYWRRILTSYLSILKGEFSINTARNCVCWLKKSCLLTYKMFTLLKLYCISCWWEMLEKFKKKSLLKLYLHFFLIFFLPTKNSDVFLEHFKLAIKWSPCDPNLNAVAFDGAEIIPTFLGSHLTKVIKV